MLLVVANFLGGLFCQYLRLAYCIWLSCWPLKVALRETGPVSSLRGSYLLSISYVSFKVDRAVGLKLGTIFGDRILTVFRRSAYCWSSGRLSACLKDMTMFLLIMCS